jgi:hypothetical protein
VTYAVAANTGAARSTTLTIAGQSFTVTQAAPAGEPPPPPPVCNYAVSPTSASFGSGGGSGTVAVTTTSVCAWFATSNASWITVTSGATGTGSGTVGTSIARNNNAARTGTLTVAGQTVTVSQSAGKNGGDNNAASANAAS